MSINTYKILHNAITRSITSLSNAETRIKEIGLANPEACQIAANTLIDTSSDIISAMIQVTNKLYRNNPDDTILHLSYDLQHIKLVLQLFRSKLPLTISYNPERQCGIYNSIKSLENINKWLNNINEHNIETVPSIDIIDQLLLNLPIRDCWTIYRKIVPIIDQATNRLRNDVYRQLKEAEKEKIKTTRKKQPVHVVTSSPA